MAGFFRVCNAPPLWAAPSSQDRCGCLYAARVYTCLPVVVRRRWTRHESSYTATSFVPARIRTRIFLHAFGESHLFLFPTPVGHLQQRIFHQACKPFSKHNFTAVAPLLDSHFYLSWATQTFCSYAALLGAPRQQPARGARREQGTQ